MLAPMMPSALVTHDKGTATHRGLLFVACAIVISSCSTPLDMTGARIALPGPEWGVVIGSVLVQPEGDGPDRVSGGKSFKFEVVQIQPGDPDGIRPYAEEYQLMAKAGEERIFVSRLRPGAYLIRSFHEASVAGLGGDLDIVFSVNPGEVRYVGRLNIEIPRRAARGKDYRFTIENQRAQTLASVPPEHDALANAAVDGPMQARVKPAS